MKHRSTLKPVGRARRRAAPFFLPRWSLLAAGSGCQAPMFSAAPAPRSREFTETVRVFTAHCLVVQPTVGLAAPRTWSFITVCLCLSISACFCAHVSMHMTNSAEDRRGKHTQRCC
ncbi:hypothetical protein BS78_01G237000 [Paspalum vaginatum]|nr:hypothetical protein BS78_01G237000 [Paspalum vaginatum]